jgi:hypothetical protein
MFWALRLISSIFGRRRRRTLAAIAIALATICSGLAMDTPARADSTVTSGTTYCIDGDQLAVCTNCNPGQSAVCTPSGAATYSAPDLLPSLGPEVTPAEETALEDLEQQAVTNTISDHQLASTDAPAVLSWDRSDAEAELFALLVQAIEAPNPTPDQHGAVDWLAGLVQAQELQTAQNAGMEYAKWAGLGVDQYESLIGTNPSEDALASFLGQQAEPFYPDDPSDETQGYCGYTPPAPDGGEWQNGYDIGYQPCYTACTDILGCTVPTPSEDQFLQWGEADTVAAEDGVYNSDAFVQAAHDISNGVVFGGAVAGSIATSFTLSQALAGVLAEGAAGAANVDAGASLTVGQTIAEALTPDLGMDEFLAGGADQLADLAATMGALGAEAVGSVAAVVILAITTLVIQGMNVFNAANLPTNLATDISSTSSDQDYALAQATGLPDGQSASYYLDGMLGVPAEASSLYSMFVAATLSPTYWPEQPPPLVPCDNTDLSNVGADCDAPPLPTSFNNYFIVTPQGSSTPEHENSISWVDGTNTDTASLSDQWFVETEVPQGAAASTFQTLDIHYTDWSGTEQNAWLLPVPNVGLEFVGFPTPSAGSPPFDPSTCESSGACWTSTSIDYVGPDGTDYSATVEPSPITLGGTVPTTLTATATTDTANPVEGSPLTFDASSELQVAGGGTAPANGVTYQWQFEEPNTYGETCIQIPIVNGQIISSDAEDVACWSAPESGAQVTQTWSASGVFEVQLTATDAAGQTAVQTFSISVGDVAPQLEVTSSCPGYPVILGVPVCPNNTVSVTGTLTHAGSDDSETVQIDWGDGTSSTVSASTSTSSNGVTLEYGTPDIDFSGTHTYTKAGLFDVTVTATDQSGAQTSASTVAISQVSQSITFRPPTATAWVYGQPPQTVQASGGTSGQPIGLASATPSVCTLSQVNAAAPAGHPAMTNALVNLVGAGTCTIRANQSGTYFVQPVAGFMVPDTTPVFLPASQVEQSFTVAPAPLTITPQPERMTYGGPVPSFVAQYNGLVNGDTASVVTGLTCGALDSSGQPVGAGTPIGQYTVTCSGASASGYTISYRTAQLSIDPALLMVTANNGTMTYGGPLPSLTASYSGLVGGDSVSSLASLTTCQTSANSRSQVGTYAVDCRADDPNYHVTYKQGTLTVTPAPLTITASSPTSTYGLGVPAITPVYSGFKNGDTTSSLSALPVCSTSANSSSPVGSYASSCSGAAAPNYAISYVDGTVTIEGASSGGPPVPATNTATTANTGLATTGPGANTGATTSTTTPAEPGATTTTTLARPGTSRTTSTTAAPSAGGTGGSSASGSASSSGGASSSGDTTSSGGGNSSSAGDGSGATHTHQPKVSSISPGAGPTAGGTGVVIRGYWFEDVTQVRFGRHDARFKVMSANSMIAWSPPGAGTVAVAVKTSAGSSDPATGDRQDHFSYLARSQVLHVSPANGPGAGGTAVVIRGQSFEDVATVSFGSHLAPFKVVSPEEIMARSPEGSGTGTVAVVVTTPGGASAGDKPSRFSYVGDARK